MIPVFAYALALAALQTPASPAALPDPLLLPINSSKRLMVKPGKMVDLKTGKPATPADVASAAADVRFVYLGEDHDNPLHHQMQADIIRALVAAGRDVAVGMEQFQRPVQPSLNGWTLGWYTDEQFIAKSDWKKQWGMDYSLYKPIFDAVKELHLPLIALNIARDWVRAVGRGGLAALPDEAKPQLPATMDLGNTNHQSLFWSLMGGHPPMPEAAQKNMYSAQVLWDEAMADSAIKYMLTRPSPKSVIVIVAGSGHVMYRQGINWRVKNRTGDPGVTVVMSNGDSARDVSRGLGEFFYLTGSDVKE
jgi:uncharacterized iron-regulated protein